MSATVAEPLSYKVPDCHTDRMNHEPNWRDRGRAVEYWLATAFVAGSFVAGLVSAIRYAQLLEPRLRIGDGFLQHLQARLVAVDVLADLGQRGLGLVACALQALRHLALVGDLLLDAGEVAADFVVRQRTR